jgi:hypothetical protein
MKITNELLESYRELIDELYINRGSYGEEKLALFLASVGKDYKNDLMIVGRAVNGWWIKINKYNDQDKDSALKCIKEGFSNDGLEWILERWGNVNKDEEYNTFYNTKTSPFWRMAMRLSHELIENNDLALNKIVWTNLYKVAKEERGNPSEQLMDVQFEKCREILNSEIKLFSPKIIIFLTGLNWAEDFLQGINNIMVNPENKYVKYVGKLNNSLIIVGKHPQGKPEEPHFNEIMNELKKAR